MTIRLLKRLGVQDTKHIFTPDTFFEETVECEAVDETATDTLTVIKQLLME